MVWFDYMLNRLQQEDVSKIEEYFDLSPGEEQPLSIWVFGRPAAGKTTTSELLLDLIRGMGHRVELVDGDAVRTLFDGNLGHSIRDRLTAFHRLILINRLLQKQGIVTITATVAGSRYFRSIARTNLINPRFIYLDCPFDVAAERDKKNLYKRAIIGEVKHFYGVDLTYEIPLEYEMWIDSARLNPDEIVGEIMDHLMSTGILE